jgi:hypothetical protein
MNSKTRNTAKLLAGVIGGSALVTMGAVTMSMHEQQAGPQPVATGRMTLAATSTEAGKDDTVEATSVAVPVIKGPAALPAEEKAAE